MYQKQLRELEQTRAIQDHTRWKMYEDPLSIHFETHGHQMAFKVFEDFFTKNSAAFGIVSYKIEKDADKKTEIVIVNLLRRTQDNYCGITSLYPLFVRCIVREQVFKNEWKLSDCGNYRRVVNNTQLVDHIVTMQILKEMDIYGYLMKEQGVPEGGLIYVCIRSVAVYFVWHKCHPKNKRRGWFGFTLPGCTFCPMHTDDNQDRLEKWQVVDRVDSKDDE